MAEVQKAALESYNKIRAERGEVTALDMFIAGRDWFKEQMMKDAIEGTARPWDNEIWCNLKSFDKLEDGDKVKVIIIKE